MGGQRATGKRCESELYVSHHFDDDSTSYCWIVTPEKQTLLQQNNDSDELKEDGNVNDEEQTNKDVELEEEEIENDVETDEVNILVSFKRLKDTLSENFVCNRCVMSNTKPTIAKKIDWFSYNSNY